MPFDTFRRPSANPPPPRPRRRARYVLAALAAFVIAAGIVGGTTSSQEAAPIAARAPRPLTPAGAPTSGAYSSTSPTGSAESGSSAESGGSAESGAAAKSGAAKSPSAAASDASGGSDQISAIGEAGAAKVVRTGSVAIEVPAEKVDRVTDAAASLAAANGGFVADRRSSDSSDQPTGYVTIRVPSENFADALAGARRLGRWSTRRSRATT